MPELLTRANKYFGVAIFRLAFFFSILFLVVFIDQLIDYKIRFFGGFYVCNSGISFGIPLSGLLFWFIAVLFLFFVAVHCVFLYKKASLPPLFILGTALFAGGALSNLLDRSLFGCVLDYFSFLGKGFPLFNLADGTIFLGSCFIVWSFLSLPPSRS